MAGGPQHRQTLPSGQPPWLVPVLSLQAPPQTVLGGPQGRTARGWSGESRRPAWRGFATSSRVVPSRLRQARRPLRRRAWIPGGLAQQASLAGIRRRLERAGRWMRLKAPRHERAGPEGKSAFRPVTLRSSRPCRGAGAALAEAGHPGMSAGAGHGSTRTRGWTGPCFGPRSTLGFGAVPRLNTAAGMNGDWRLPAPGAGWARHMAFRWERRDRIPRRLLFLEAVLWESGPSRLGHDGRRAEALEISSAEDARIRCSLTSYRPDSGRVRL
jgi:hypothetical protein